MTKRTVPGPCVVDPIGALLERAGLAEGFFGVRANRVGLGNFNLFDVRDPDEVLEELLFFPGVHALKSIQRLIELRQVHPKPSTGFFYQTAGYALRQMNCKRA